MQQTAACNSVFLLIFLICCFVCMCAHSPLLTPPVEGQHPDLVTFLEAMWGALPPGELVRAVYPVLSSYLDPETPVGGAEGGGVQFVAVELSWGSRACVGKQGACPAMIWASLDGTDGSTLEPAVNFWLLDTI
jgi:hypothetical protein